MKRFYRIPNLMKVSDLRDVINYAKRRYASKIAYRQIETPIYESAITFRGFADNISALGTALMRLPKPFSSTARPEGGATPAVSGSGDEQSSSATTSLTTLSGSHIALIGGTSIEWLTAFFATMNGVGCAVPIDRLLDPDTMVAQLVLADVDAIFCEGSFLDKLQPLLPRLPKVRAVIVMRGTGSAVDLLKKLSVEDQDRDYYAYTRLVAHGRALVRAHETVFTEAPIDADTMSLLVFTSGTTGANKGVMLCHRNIVTVMKGARQLTTFRRTNLSVLPINHTYELVCNIICSIWEGTTVAINDDLRHVARNLEHFGPEMSSMVPMMLDLLVRKITIESKRNGLWEHLQYGMKVSAALRLFGIDRRRRFFKPVLQALGGNLSMVVSGGAPLAHETESFLDAIGIDVKNGYGITECAPLVASCGDHYRRAGSVGHVLPNIDVRIANPDEHGNGEIQVKGDNVMLGYYKMPEDTATVFTDDGWLRTGDLGHVDKDGYLFLTGRLKNLIILANGKNVSPEDIEEHIMHGIDYVRECVVYSDDAGTGIYAVCFLDDDQCEQLGLHDQQARHDRLMEDIRIVNRSVPSYKRIADVSISDHEFEKTTTQKIRRFKVIERMRRRGRNDS
ncbi:aMP-forming long-chain acyl-CoA synthetase [Bifidobacterium tissieri]|uniref:AMP-forming long-chain acyl-CoA synthetase n=1 Tax=Bifidobacterium tissieri TaxID=1630162 RepID=A0A261FBW2_9BIFI|nr:AMP-binding protein [Bifidobacterium tissieri]OZG56594.1 aMP-forming long-chain acyl-CoA synthetase [Bifidobacterium tissieri]